MDPAVTGALIGVGGVFAGAFISAGGSMLVQNRQNTRADEQTRRMVRELYRNAFMALNGVMFLGYVDEPGRFEHVMQLLINRVSRDDVTTAFADSTMIVRSIPALLDGLHGCMRAFADWQELGAPTDDAKAVEAYAERVRESASVALALCGTVLVEIGEGDYFGKNLLPVNGVRILRYMQEEKDRQTIEHERDKAEVEAFRVTQIKAREAEDSTGK